MKKIISFVLALTLLLSLLPGAQAATTLNPAEKRGIKLQKVGLNVTEPGLSPTTGLPLAELEAPDGFAGLAVTGRYQPMMVQIDNYNGGIGELTPWGATYADVVYESPLDRAGYTRISFVFSDLIPDSVGPVRSARVGHCWLREEWDAGFMFYGGQELEGSSIRDEFRKTGATKKGVLFDGTSGTNKPWMQYYNKRSGLTAPHDKNGNAAAMSELIPLEHEVSNHTFLFTDEMPTGDTAELITVDWGAENYNSVLEYDADSNQYFRYIYRKSGLVPYMDCDNQVQLSFNNVLVQHAEVTFNRYAAAPVTHHVGEGNADYFIGGVHLTGYWKRDNMESRTVFYTADGQELQLQRGKTFIIVCPKSTTITYE